MDQSLLQATIELIIEGGLDAATIHAVAERSGVARATIYLRWPSRAKLVEAALRHAVGRRPYPLSGNIEADLRRGAQQARAVFSEPLFVAVLPVLIPALIRAGNGDGAITYDVLIPNRRLIADEYREHAATQGWRTDVDAEVIADLVVGALLIQLVATGQAPTERHAEQAVELVLAGLRAQVR